MAQTQFLDFPLAEIWWTMQAIFTCLEQNQAGKEGSSKEVTSHSLLSPFFPGLPVLNL